MVIIIIRILWQINIIENLWFFDIFYWQVWEGLVDKFSLFYGKKKPYNMLKVWISFINWYI